MIEFRTPKYICLKKIEPPVIRYQPRTMFVKVQHLLQTRGSVDTSLTLSQTDAKMQSQQSEISNLSTFYQSCDQAKENIQQPIIDVVLKKTNSFHLNSKMRSNNKISRISKNQLMDVLQEITSPTQTKRKQVVNREWEYSYRKQQGNSTFFQSMDSSNEQATALPKCRSFSMKQQSTQQKSQQLKDMIDKAINNTKTFDEYLLSLVSG
ncbi:unnamed protein product (macronuclear) [Paramecium tetraurelia]|uniref:Uncharacterized protein n=2 Tax=Paramecium TaxID=5884 RepID=A0D6K0_PARTE|nr:uncharacterized protein GSPATT00001708001 [Paramecium tetraurelia]CAD8135502.1 unnamed protein product [Paramecium octaurelia]CAK78667.1 unnamed protein product [Paramecium tetraurelia]|eukprot:XP_001446064.1 hypothetical protein (macronuclear) [Paramecium tetraurelia strain d4-2]